MSARTTIITNDQIALAKANVKILINWADVDAEHSAAIGAQDTAQDDRLRGRILRKALALLEQCEC